MNGRLASLGLKTSQSRPAASAPRTVRSIRGARSTTSAAEQLGVFLLLQVVDQLDVLIGDLLDLVEPLLLVVLGQAVVLEHLLQAIVGVAAHLADAVAAFLA